MKQTAFCIIVSILLIAISCTNNTKGLETTENAGPIDQYLVAHTPRTISVKESLILQFATSIATPSDSDVRGVKIKPQIRGKFSWSSPGTLIFEPTERFEYDNKYSLELNLSELLQNSSNNDLLTLQFITRPLDLDIAVGRLTSEDGAQWSVKGKVTSSDFADPAQVKKMVTIDKPQLSIEWSTSNNSRDHSFVINNIDRGDVASEITLSWDGKKFDEDFAGDIKIDVPSKSDYSLKDVYIQDKGSTQIVAIFSDLLDPRQNMKGLIQIKDQKEPKYQISGSQLFIYPEDINLNELSLFISSKIKNSSGKELSQEYDFQLNIAPKVPQIKLLGNGNIVSTNMQFTLPIEVINLKAIDLEIFKIHSDNVLQFLQNNNLDGDWYLDQVGKIVHTEKIDLQKIRTPLYNQWDKYGIDLSTYIAQDPGAIYQVRFGFRPGYITYPCDQVVGYSEEKKGESFMRYIYDYPEYNYDHESQPCYGAFYNPSNFTQRNILISDIATTVKKGRNNKYFFNITDISSTDPVSDATISLFDFQKQGLAKDIKSVDGTAIISTDLPASFAIVKWNNSFNYIKLEDSEALSITDFETDGRSREGEIDGFIYTDRGVYRPGDTLYVNFMIDDPTSTLPTNHPVKMTLKNAKGQSRFSEIRTQSKGGIYSFNIPTQQKDLTGLWTLITEVGPNQFFKNVRVEAIKPNKLKINITVPKEVYVSSTTSESVTLSSEWLYGAPARGLQAKVEARLDSREMGVKSLSNFTFTDPSRSIPQDIQVLYDGNLDDNGIANMRLDWNTNGYPGKATAYLSTRVFEKGGEYSENYSKINISPFQSYVGISIPENRWGYKNINRENPDDIKIISTDAEGKSIANKKVSIGVYDINWRWWYYENERYNLYSLNSDKHTKAIYTAIGNTDNSGKLNYKIDSQKLGYGRKLIRICDLESGHCTGDFFYMSSYNATVAEDERNSLNKISIVTDKTTYDVGDEVRLTIPSEPNSRLLISIENDKEVIIQDWVTGKANQTEYSFNLNEEMAPNIYCHVSLIQSNSRTNNLPIRLYGIAPISVVDKEKKLNPSIDVAEELAPNKKFSVKVSEENKKSMSYTIAIVDEGLLDLTNYKTPSPYDHFYAKRALGVKSWDVYDQILQGYGDGFGRIISVGGDGDGDTDGADKQAIRFKPVVMSAGPFTLKAGKFDTHEFTMPNYFGAVRVMVVAKKDGAYGSQEISAKVKDPLMIFPTLPRTISIGESVVMPVNLIATKDNLGSIALNLSHNALLQTTGSSNSTVNSTSSGEQMLFFDLQAGDQTGIAKVEVKSTSGTNSSSQSIELNVRNPMPIRTVVLQKVLAANEKWDNKIQFFGTPGTNSAIVEISQIPPINLNNRLEYLIRYPYGCAEQTTSSVFPQLYLDQITSISNDRKKEIDSNINAGISRLQRMQTSSGGFAYWPGDSYEQEWTSIYTGQFLLEAKQKGYAVSRTVLDNWVNVETKKASQFRTSKSDSKRTHRAEYLTQAYRLYALAQAGKYNLSAMNLLRLESDLPNAAKFLLSAAYSKSGNTKVSYELIKSVSTEIENDYDHYYNYGSELRDQAILAQAALDGDRSDDGFVLLQSIAKKLNSSDWYSTQSIAQGLLAIGKYLDKFQKDNLKFILKSGAATAQNIDFKQAIYIQNLDIAKGETVSITNTSTANLYAKINIVGQDSPASITSLPATSSNIILNVSYKDLSGAPIDVTSLEQGTDFMAEVSISNPKSRNTTINELALTQIIPSGWEIRSGRLSDQGTLTQEDNYDYRDVKDDRVHTFFDLSNKKTFRILLNAAYIGEYFLPPVKLEAMYDNGIQASTKGQRVKVLGSPKAK